MAGVNRLTCSSLSRNTVAMCGAGQQVHDVVVGAFQFAHLLLEAGVDRVELLVEGLQLLLRGLQLLVGGLQLFVGGRDLFVGGLELVVGAFQLLDGALELLAGDLQLIRELLDVASPCGCSAGSRAGSDGLRRSPAAARRFPGDAAWG